MKSRKSLQRTVLMGLGICFLFQSTFIYASEPISLQNSDQPKNEKSIPDAGEPNTKNSHQPIDGSDSTTTDFLANEDQGVLGKASSEPDSKVETSGEFNKLTHPVQELRKGIHDRKKPGRKKTSPPEEKAGKIMVMTSESCTNPSGSSNHSVCTRTFSDRSTAEVDINEKMNGNEFRQMTTITEFDPNHRLSNVKTIYKGVQYSDLKTKAKEFEFFDISYTTTSGGPVYKEVLIYDYHAETGKVKKMTWGRYEQADSLAEPVLVSHAYLTYDKSGTPDKGLAETVDEGYLTAQFLDWNESKKDAEIASSREIWRGWENWITSRQVSIYLS